eukprot:TRINITY_DN89305_c2_g1_i2.p1 TRINITY_DN89305_c2_g1~~TRINITY_DN89305_c2_g1_i2.p1  ORF type:complete len:170 (-),score=12.77 TRINITY_DN89305_c2_g1_i2:156-665(-)
MGPVLGRDVRLSGPTVARMGPRCPAPKPADTPNPHHASGILPASPPCESDSQGMSNTQPKRLGASLSFIVAGGLLGLVAIISRPGDIQASDTVQPSEAPRHLMIDERPVLGELQGEGERTVILGGEEISYLDAGPGGEWFDSTIDSDDMLAEPIQLMLVEESSDWQHRV